MKHVIIVHGWEGDPNIHWFPWLESRLEAQGVRVETPTMPNTMHPNEKEWVEHLQEVVGKADEDIFLIGHSLGGITILRYLESLPEGEKIGGAIFVASFPESIDRPEINSFFTVPVDYAKILMKISPEKIIAIHSTNDPYVPMKNGEILRDKLGAKLVIIQNGGHFLASDGYVEFPEVFTQLEHLMSLEKESC